MDQNHLPCGKKPNLFRRLHHNLRGAKGECLQTDFWGMTPSTALATSIRPFYLKSMLGNGVHMYLFLELTLDLKNLPPKALLFGALQMVAVESPFAYLVAG